MFNRTFRAARLALAIFTIVAGAGIACLPENEATPTSTPAPTPVTPAPPPRLTATAPPTLVPTQAAMPTAKPTVAATQVVAPKPTLAPTATAPVVSPTRPAPTVAPTAAPATPTPPPVNHTLSNTRLFQVTFANSVLNKGFRTARDVESLVALPRDTLSQKVVKVAIEPEPASYFTDSWGNRVAYYKFGQLETGAEAKVVWTALVELSDIKYDIDAGKVGTLAQIPQDVKYTYTADGKYFRLWSPTIQRAARSAVAGEKNMYNMVKRIHDYVVKYLTYKEEFWDRYDWDAADRILLERSGVCSEYAFLFIALCRTNGIPARFYTGTWRKGEGPVVDDRFHRAAEVFFPNYGWIPVDPTLDDLAESDKYGYFGAAKNDTLTLITAGGESEYLGWNYHSLNRWSLGVRTVDMQVYRSAEWLPQ